MKTFALTSLVVSGGSFALMLTGCASQNHTLTSPYHPGPVIGQAVGTGVGAVGGNIVGVGVGLGEGAVKGAVAPFDNTSRVVRRWHTETTSDGRTIQVPVDILVDTAGRPIGISEGR